MRWQKLPKIELHLHLDCSLSYDVVSRIDPAISREAYQARFVAPTKCEDLTEFLQCAPASFPLMQSQANLRLVTLDLFEQLRQDNVIYAEIRFAPLLHTQQGLSPREVVAVVEASTAEGVRKTGVEARVILCTLRYFSPEQSMETVRLAEAFRGTYVAGFDIAADAPGDVIADHAPAFQYAREHGIPYTAHAGESRGLENVWDTLRHFAPRRLGHGVCCVEDPALLDTVRQEHIHLEACPSCNVQTGCYETFADHPIDRLHRAGVSLSVNTDARTLVDTTLSKEYAKLHRTFGWVEGDFYHCNRHALEAAFIADDVRRELVAGLNAGYRV